MPRFERLSPAHPILTFTSGNGDLDTWLHAAANTADRAGMARVYLWLDDANELTATSRTADVANSYSEKRRRSQSANSGSTIRVWLSASRTWP